MCLPGELEMMSTPTFKATDDSSQDSNTAAIHFQVVTPAAIDDVFFLEQG